MSNYIPSLLSFLVVVISVVLITAFITFTIKDVSFSDYIKSARGKGAAASALLAVAVLVVLSLIIFLIPSNANANPFAGGTWFNDAGIYAGIDYTRNPSPQCDQDDPFDNRGTSNLGAWINGWQSQN